MELVNEWFPTGKFRKFGTPFSTDSTYEKELMAALSLTGDALHKSEMEYHGKFGHTLGRIQQIALMIRIGFFTQTAICKHKLWHLLFLVPKVPCAEFNIWIVTLVNPSFILLIMMMD